MKPWHQFKQENPDGFYSKDYSKHKFVVYQHQTSGHLNGYVLLNPEDTIEDMMDIECHGGITFEGNLAEIIPVQAGNWIGFDCAHYGDMTPFADERLASLGFDFGVSYDKIWRTPDFVEENCKLIINQLEDPEYIA